MPRRFTVLALVTSVSASIALFAQGAIGQGTVKQHGRAIVQYRSPEVAAVASYEYSQRNHAGPWLLIDFAVQAKDRITIQRNQFSLRTPGEREVPLATHQQFLDAHATLTALYQNASIFRRPLDSYFATRPLEGTIRFFTNPGTTISDSAVTNPDAVATGALLFVAPQGSWPEGEYRLVLNHPSARAELPIRLQ